MTDIAVVILSNRKDLYISSAVASLANNVTGFSSVEVFDDSGDAEWVERTGATPVSLGENLGYTEAMRKVWDFGRKHGGPVFFLEEDFTIEEKIDLQELHDLLAADQNLMQVALQRQPWYEAELKHGGVIAALEKDRHWCGRFQYHPGRVEHDVVFTTNPCLIPARTFAHDWPNGPRSEQAFSRYLARRGFKFAYWGEAGHVTCTHHGEVTAGGGH